MLRSRFALGTVGLLCTLGCVPDRWKYPAPIDAAVVDALDAASTETAADDASPDATPDVPAAPLDVLRCDGDCLRACGRGPVNLYRADGDARDAAGHRHGTASPGVTYVQGRIGLAFNFSGSDYVSLPAPVGDFEGDFTISLWFKSQHSGEVLTRRSACWGGAAYIGEDLGLSATGLVAVEMLLGPGYFVERTTDTYLDDAWHHTALVRHGDTLDLVLDGRTAATHAMTASFTDPSASPTYLGVSRCCAGAPGGNGTADPRQWLRGAIDEVAFYDRALSPDELLAVAEGRCAP